MDLRIDRDLFFPVGERPARPAASARPAGTGRQHLDQISFSARLSGLEGRVQDLTAQLSQQVRVRPTRQELSTLQEQVEAGTYRPDAGEIAARMLLLGEVGR